MNGRSTARQVVEVTDIGDRLDDLLDRVKREETRVIVQRDGVAVAVAALVSSDELARMERVDTEREARFRVVAEVRSAFNDLSADEIDREADRAVAKLRAEAAAGG